MKGVADVMRDHGLVNGLRTDLHEPNCPGMDEDGNWLGPCDCAKQHEGMPPIIWASEAGDRWISNLEQIRGAYNASRGGGYIVRLVITDPTGVPSPVEGRTQVTVEGPMFGVGRDADNDGFPYIEILLDHYGPGTGHAARFSSEEITSIYIY